MVSIENAQLNGLVRLELFNDSNQLFEENPILYLNSLEEIERVLSHVELEKKIQRLRWIHQVKVRK